MLWLALIWLIFSVPFGIMVGIFLRSAASGDEDDNLPGDGE